MANCAAPFVFPFQTENQHYLFDVNTRRILRVDKIMHDLVQEFGTLSPEAIFARHDGEYSLSQIESAIVAVNEFQAKGLLLPNRVQEIATVDAQDVVEELTSKRQQLILEVTTACNFRCTYCVYDSHDGTFRGHGREEMPWSVARAAIDDFMAYNSRSEMCAISFYGGEPLLNMPLIHRCVEYVGDAYPQSKPSFSLTTNGFLLTDEAIDLLVSNHFNVSISIDGPEAVHDACRRTKDGQKTWQVVTENLRRFVQISKERNGDCYVIVNAVGGLEADLGQVIDYFSRTDYLPEEFSLIFASDRAYASAIKPGCRLYDSAREASMNLDEQLIRGDVETDNCAFRVASSVLCKELVKFHKRHLLISSEGISRIVHSACIPGGRRLMVTVDGKYLPCERVERLESTTIGSCKEGVAYEKVQELMQNWLSFEGCKTCWCVTTCNVGCFATVAVDASSDRPPKQDACDNHRRQRHSLLVRYCRILEKNPGALDYARGIQIT